MDRKEITLIKQAIMKEVRAYEFYKLAAKQAENEELKGALMNMANEEMKHVEWLNDLFDKIKDDSLDDYTLASTDAPDTDQLFKWDSIKQESLDMLISVFGIAVDMEKSAVEFYQKAEKESDLEAAKKLFGMLVSWEKVHLDKFSQDYEKLQDDWWATQNFAPF